MWIGKENRLILVFITFVLILISFFFIPSLIKSSDFVYEGRCDACHTQAQDAFVNVKPPKDIKCTNCHAIIEFSPDLYTHTATTFGCVECTQKEFYVEGHPFRTIVGRPAHSMSMTIDTTKGIHEIEVYLHRYNNLVSDYMNGFLTFLKYIIALIILTSVIIFITNKGNK